MATRRSERGAGAPRTARRALVLVLVLIVVLMIALAGFTFAELMLTENKATRLHGQQLQLQQAIHSGIEQLLDLCEQPYEAQAAAGGTFDNPKLLRAIPLEPDLTGGRVEMNHLRFSVVAPAAVVAPGERSSASLLRFGVENESGRLHLADLLYYEQYQPGAGRDALLQLPGMTEEIAEAILDWIDADSTPRPLGAEHDYYASLDQPYLPRNALPETLEELLLVKGVTRELFFGADSNYNRRIDPDEQMAASASPTFSAGQSSAPWHWFLTLHSAQANRNAQGQPRINVNMPNLSMLHEQLTAALGPQMAAFIVAYRQYGPAVGATAGSAVQGTPMVNPAESAAFTIVSLLDLVDASVAVPGSGAAVYASPWSGDPQSLAQPLEQLFDVAAITDQPVTRGLVSVNHAPQEVLQAVPGIGEALAQQIVSARQAPTAAGAQSERRFATWLYTEGLVDLETMKRLLPFVSGGGDVVRAQIVAYHDQPGPTARTEVVVDATQLPARVLQRRDLRMHGSGFPREWLSADGAPTLLHN